ncbi:hypothetical protein, partial [Escherichia coli]|uniref:hypothetical protein n=1 Tax=Escherichia coli TaxID=562 RepID=UPI002866FB1C
MTAYGDLPWGDRQALTELSQRETAEYYRRRAETISPNLARVWRVPLANGYGPLASSRLNRLLAMAPDGFVHSAWSADADRSLDILGVRYVSQPAIEDERTTTAVDEATALASPDLNISIGTASCNATHGARVAFDLPSWLRVSSLQIVAALACSIDITDETQIARVRVVRADGSAEQLALRAGSDVSEWAYDCAEVRARVRHKQARI